MSPRMSADERRAQVLRAAVAEFAVRGLEGTSTESIARRVGISQPYLFRLFPGKKALFIAACEHANARILEVMVEAADGRYGEDALEAMGEAYAALIDDRDLLLMMLQQFASCHDEDVRQTVQGFFPSLWDAVARLTGLPARDLTRFMARGMLCNVISAVGREGDHLDDRWLRLADTLAKQPL